MKLISLHTGLDRVDPRKFDGWTGELRGCTNDATVESALAARAGFTARTFFDEHVTLGQYAGEYALAAQELVAGDVFEATHSGHGTEDGNGEYLVLHDGLMSDRVRHQLLAAFKPGVIIILVDDTCYAAGTIRARFGAEPAFRTRFAPAVRAERTARVAATSEIQATLLHLAACRATEESAEDDRHGYFTRARQETLERLVQPTWREWFEAVQAAVSARNPFQHPQALEIGAETIFDSLRFTYDLKPTQPQSTGGFPEVPTPSQP